MRAFSVAVFASASYRKLVVSADALTGRSMRARRRCQTSRVPRGGRSSLAISRCPVSVLTKFKRWWVATGKALNCGSEVAIATPWQRSHKVQAAWPPLLGSGVPPASAVTPSPWQGAAARCCASGAACVDEAATTAPVIVPKAMLTCMSLVAQPRKGSRANKIHKMRGRKRMAWAGRLEMSVK